MYEAFLPPEPDAGREERARSALNASVESLESEATSTTASESGRASPMAVVLDDAAVPAPQAAAVEPGDVRMDAPVDNLASAEAEEPVRACVSLL